MRYFTKEYQKDMGRMDLHLLVRVNKKAEKFDEKFYQDLYEKELKNFLKDKQEICEIDEVYNEEKLIEEFEQNHLYDIDFLKRNLPKDILEDVSDIRVLALNKASKSIKKRIESYCIENEKRTKKVKKEYQKYLKKIENEIPNKILENYDFHDCKIISIEQIGDDIIVNFDNSGEFIGINKIIYRNGRIIENNFKESSYWIHDEVYKLDEGYEFHIGINSSDEYEYDYITLTATDVDFE